MEDYPIAPVVTKKIKKNETHIDSEDEDDDFICNDSSSNDSNDMSNDEDDNIDDMDDKSLSGDSEEEDNSVESDASTPPAKPTLNKKSKKSSNKVELPFYKEFSLANGKSRRIEVSEFKGKLGVNIREYYLDRNVNEMKPGRAGIWLKPDEYLNLVKSIPEITTCLQSNFDLNKKKKDKKEKSTK